MSRRPTGRRRGGANNPRGNPETLHRRGRGREAVNCIDARLDVFINRLTEGSTLREAAQAIGVTPNYAGRLSRKLLVREEIDRRRALLRDKSQVTAERVVQELLAIAFSDITDTFPIEGDISYLHLRSLPQTIRAAIKSFKITYGDNGTTVHVEMYDKKVALERLCKMLGLGEDLTIEKVLAAFSPEIRDRMEVFLRKHMEHKPPPVLLAPPLNVGVAEHGQTQTVQTDTGRH